MYFLVLGKLMLKLDCPRSIQTERETCHDSSRVDNINCLLGFNLLGSHLQKNRVLRDVLTLKNLRPSVLFFAKCHVSL